VAEILGPARSVIKPGVACPPRGPKILPVGARGVVRTAQFNGKQEWTPPGAEAACAAPATVKQTTPQRVTPFHPATGRPETGAWEGGKGSICQPGYRPTRRLPHRQP